MQVKSKAQLVKLQELLKDGFITQAEYERKTTGIDLEKLPDRISTEQKKEAKRHHANGSGHKRAW